MVEIFLKMFGPLCLENDDNMTGTNVYIVVKPTCRIDRPEFGQCAPFEYITLAKLVVNMNEQSEIL